MAQTEGMAKRYGEGVGGIDAEVTHGCVAEQNGHHRRHLFLTRIAVTRNGLFYPARSIFKDRNVVVERRSNHHPLRPPQFEGALDVFAVEGRLDRQSVGFVKAHKRHGRLQDLPQPLG